jgi:hypothetical protein
MRLFGSLVVAGYLREEGARVSNLSIFYYPSSSLLTTLFNSMKKLLGRNFCRNQETYESLQGLRPFSAAISEAFGQDHRHLMKHIYARCHELDEEGKPPKAIRLGMWNQLILGSPKTIEFAGRSLIVENDPFDDSDYVYGEGGSYPRNRTNCLIY